MAEALNGHAPRPSPAIILKLISVPQKGAIIVRFLGEMKATMVHWVPGKPKGHGEVCLGPDCDSTNHKRKIAWKGYAPAEIWRPTDEDWYPCVLEITEALGHQLWDRRLLGETWELQRCQGDFKHPEVVGTFLTADRPPPIITDSWVDTVCFRLYRTTEIKWGALDPLPNRVMLTTRSAPPPPKIQTAPPENPAIIPPPKLPMREQAKLRGVTL